MHADGVTPPTETLAPDELRALEAILAKLSGPGAHLPWPLFRFMTEVMATVNVDLLVRDPARGVLLAWREDPFGQGWHVPGSIIRHREEIEHRIVECAHDEFGCELDVTPGPCAVVQIFDDRGHSVSLCFLASLRGEPEKRVVGESGRPEPGDLRWFGTVPEALYPSHRIYRDVLARLDGVGEVRVFTQHVGRRDAAQASPAGEIEASPLT